MAPLNLRLLLRTLRPARHRRRGRDPATSSPAAQLRTGKLEKERETEILFAINIDVLENVWVHHATTQYLEPTCMSAHAAAIAAHYAADIHLSGRFRKRKERGPEANSQIVTLKKMFHEIGKNTLQNGEIDVFVHP